MAFSVVRAVTKFLCRSLWYIYIASRSLYLVSSLCLSEKHLLISLVFVKTDLARLCSCATVRINDIRYRGGGVRSTAYKKLTLLRHSLSLISTGHPPFIRGQMKNRCHWKWEILLRSRVHERANCRRRHNKTNKTRVFSWIFNLHEKRYAP